MERAPELEGSFVRSRVRVPSHVIYRSFAAETVVLNLNEGRYHGLNPVAADMLTALDESDNVLAAAERLAGEYGQRVATIIGDLEFLVRQLVERQLVEVEDPSA